MTIALLKSYLCLVSYTCIIEIFPPVTRLEQPIIIALTFSLPRSQKVYPFDIVDLHTLR